MFLSYEANKTKDFSFPLHLILILLSVWHEYHLPSPASKLFNSLLGYFSISFSHRPMFFCPDSGWNGHVTIRKGCRQWLLLLPATVLCHVCQVLQVGVFWPQRAVLSGVWPTRQATRKKTIGTYSRVVEITGCFKKNSLWLTHWVFIKRIWVILHQYFFWNESMTILGLFFTMIHQTMLACSKRTVIIIVLS